jgi:hypothetical protein
MVSLKGIVLGILVIIIVYFLITWIFSDKSRTYLLTKHNAKTQTSVSPSNIVNSYNSDYTYSFWVFISNWNYNLGKVKNILTRGDFLSVDLDSTINNLSVSLATITDSKNQSKQNCILPNIPLQTWANVIISLNDRALDIYLDGKLVKTCVSPGVPVQRSGTPLEVCKNGGFDGFLSSLSYYSRAINPREAYAIYKDGPGGGSWFSNIINKYRLKIAFMEDNKEVNSLEI